MLSVSIACLLAPQGILGSVVIYVIWPYWWAFWFKKYIIAIFQESAYGFPAFICMFAFVHIW